MRRFLLVPAACLLLGAPAAHAGSRAGRRARGQYKRVHIRAMKQLLAGQAKPAEQWCHTDLEERGDDPETLFCLTLAQAQLGQLDKASATVKRAVGAGLPLGRFLAGPRGLVQPLVQHAAFQEFLRAHSAGLVHGPMLGCVTDHSARFWVRTAVASAVQVTVVPHRAAKAAEAITSSVVRTGPKTDFTAVAEVAGLKPDTEYEYGVAVDGKPVLGAKLPVFRTYSPAGRPARFHVAFGGGAGYVPPHERMWDTILSHHPRALLLLGDNVYIDTPKSPGIQLFCYYRRQSRPEYRRLCAAAPVYAIWDDHDFGTNDCVPGPDIEEPAWKVPVWEVFCQNWNNPAYGGGTRTQPGCWFDFAIADVDVFMTDGRFYRTNPKAENPSMLGPVQKAWLLKRLGASKAAFKVLVSGVPWAIGTKGGSRDTWDGFPAEREEIFAFIDKHKIGGVVLLSADRHRSDVWRIDRPNGYTLHEFESSRLTNQHRHGAIRNKNCLFSYNATQSFGLLTFDTTAADPTVTYEIIDIGDKLIHTFALKRSQLSR